LPHRTITWRDKLRYRFENTLSRGTIAIIAWLAALSALLVLVAAVVLAVLGLRTDPADPNSQLGFFEGGWQSLMHAIDAGNLAGDQGFALRVVMLVVTIGGIFIVSMLIGTITAGLDARLQQLRKGRSRVIEQDHTLILGWSSKVYSIIGELMIANANQKNPCIVVMADRDKVEMEDDIRAKFPSTANTRVICRRGDTLDLDDLAVVDPHRARSIIVLAPENDNPDMHVIKAVLALTNHPQRKATPYHIIAELQHETNLEAAALVGGNEAIFIRGDDLIARVTAQTCRQSGLSVVYTELLDFDGAEIYFCDAGSLVGSSYRQVLSAFDSSAVMGLACADGQTLINPPMDTVLRAGDQVIAISEDDDTLAVSKTTPPAPNLQALNNGARAEPRPERTLILGWNDKASAIVRELDHYVVPGSELLVLCRRDGARETLLGLSQELKRLRIRFADGEITQRATLDKIGVQNFDHIILLSYRDLPMQEADAQTLIALLHLRNIAQGLNVDLNIVSEMMDERNRTLATVAQADDFIVSDKLVSLMLSQLAENKRLDAVFQNLFSAEGAEVYLRPISDYIKPNVEVDFYTVLEAAARRHETAIGYRIAAQASDKTNAYGVKINPTKSERLRFAANDLIIVLAED
jgi:ion channel POLLUX/CASTOR